MFVMSICMDDRQISTVNLEAWPLEWWHVWCFGGSHDVSPFVDRIAPRGLYGIRAACCEDRGSK
jgi:hypothetical protein